MSIPLAHGQSGSPSAGDIAKKATVLKQEKLWSRAMELFSNGEDEDSAKQFLTFYKRYPDNIRAEQALWRSASLYRGLAFTSSDVEWDRVMELFRSFTLEYPESKRLADAYFEVAHAYSQMNYHREAITYYSLYLKRFPAASKASKAAFLKAGSLLQIKRFNEAAGVYESLKQSDDPTNRLRGQAGEGHIFFLQGKYHDALGIYKRILRHNPSYYIDDPEILRFMGIASLRVNNDEEGLENLIHYLNLTGPGQFRADVLFEMAESYFKQGNILAANHFYEQIISEGDKDDRLVLLSRFRLAQKKESTLAVFEKDKLEELSVKKHDKPFQDVLDKHYTEPLSQDARYELIKRHWQRQEFDQAFVIGKAYLRYDTEEDQEKEVHDILGRILEKEVEELLNQQKYEDVYQIYLDEYPYIKGYQRGRLLFLVGRALESMSLWKEASTVYYRALGLSLTPEEMLDLYFHRAQTYIAGNDVKSAQRLLKYLRKIYVSEPAIAKIYFLSGKLRELQQRKEDALAFFQMAVESYPADGKKAEYAENYLRLLFDQEKIAEAEKALGRFAKERWLGSEKEIDWFIRLGDAYRAQEKFIQAIEAYQSVLADKPPANPSVLQAVHLYLGDALLKIGDEKAAFSHLEMAIAGNDSTIQGLARERLEQARIDKSLVELAPVLQW
jgi:tetratricopeptide (TPR) repeat protein